MINFEIVRQTLVPFFSAENWVDGAVNTSVLFGQGAILAATGSMYAPIFLGEGLMGVIGTLMDVAPPPAK